MKILLLLIAALLFQVAVAGEPLVWSKHSSALKLSGVDDFNNFATFTGDVTISGELVFVFEASGRDADLLWVRLIPDPGESEKLPQVVKGAFPDKLQDLWVLPARTVLEHFSGVEALARAGKGPLRNVRRHATLVLTKYTTGAECSHTRSYHATLVRVVTDDPPQMSVSVGGLHGC